MIKMCIQCCVYQSLLNFSEYNRRCKKCETKPTYNQLEKSQSKLYYYEVLTTSASAGFFSGYLLETDFGYFDYWNEDDNVMFYNNKQDFLEDMESKEGRENFILVEMT